VWAFLLSIASLAFTKDRKLFADVEGLTWTFWQHSIFRIVTIMWSVHEVDGDFVPGKEFCTQIYEGSLTELIDFFFFNFQVLEYAIKFIFLQMPPPSYFPKIVLIQHLLDKKFCICRFPVSEVTYLKFCKTPIRIVLNFPSYKFLCLEVHFLGVVYKTFYLICLKDFAKLFISWQ
jgi:hypothetical protein